MITLAQVCADEAATVSETAPLNDLPERWDADWQDLAHHASEANPFAECWFMRAAIVNLGTAPGDRMITVWRKDTLIGMIAVTTARRYGRIPVRHIQNWTHYHCFLGVPLVRAGSETLFWTVVLATLDAAEWAPGFLHIVGLDPAGPVFQTLQSTRQADVVHRSERAMLQSALDSTRYYEANVRAKKRKEIRRLRARLHAQGQVELDHLAPDEPIGPWIDQFLRLEQAGWKGRKGTALATHVATKKFFEQSLAGAHRAARLQMVRLTVDQKPIAMLVNFITPPGAYAFKIAFDEDYARFSPGVLLKIDTLTMLDRPDIDWTDSCAVEDHPMINSLWAERRPIVRVTVPLAGMSRKTIFHATRTVETVAARLRGRL